MYIYKDTYMIYKDTYDIFFVDKQQIMLVQFICCPPKRLFFSQCMITSANMEICPIDY